VIVPGIGFDSIGNRLGRGIGCYDRFLQTIDALFIGIGYSCQLVSSIPVEYHDMKMDIVVTEKGVIQC
jgi:5-formyltetrahydrofolate cyclo-ligase